MSQKTSAERTVLQLKLEPLVGSRFQPTGFPDLGAATFERPDREGNWTDALLLESAQSMANHLEATTWDLAAKDQPAALEGVPFVRVVNDTGLRLTSSRVEAHRLACAYIMDGAIGATEGRVWLQEKFGLVAGRPLDNRAVAAAIAELDPVSLVHGVFFAQKKWPWQPKIARAVTCFIEAHDVKEALSGGVKKDSVILSHGKDGEVKSASSEGYGMVPHHRTEYSAKEIIAYVAVDHAQVRSYGLSEPATELVDALIDYELATLFAGGLRLRTACDLTVVDVDGELPDAAVSAKRVGSAVAALGKGTVHEVVWTGRGKAS